ncbi:AAA family ATPase [Kribbella sp. CA-253562]|uniref:helix-turn-helix transcriptional regulator n=1 Tax=Kribbella sp. CA-253562 TaxID=3239942 RepID=UPI003D8EAD9B
MARSGCEEAAIDPEERPVAALVGRKHEIAQLELALNSGRKGLRCYLLPGDPGIGKSRLLDELRKRAESRHAVVWATQGLDTDRELNFGLVSSMIRSAIAAPRSPGPVTSAACTKLMGLLSRLESTRVPSAVERGQVVRAVRDLAESLADRTLVLLIDDAHWLDNASVDLLRQLSGQPQSARMMICAAYRPRQASTHLRAAVDALITDGAHVLRLGALSPDEARIVLGASTPPQIARHAIESGGGVPEYLIALATQAKTGQAESVAIRSEYGALAAETQAIAKAAAVLGSEFDPGYLAAVSGRSGDEVAAALDDLARRDILRAGRNGLLMFRHEIVQRVFYDLMGPGERRVIHARAAEALQAAGAPAEERAVHLEATATVGDITAVGVLLRAAISARWREPTSAARWYAAASRLLPVGHPAHPPLSLAGAESLLQAGQLQGALRAFNHTMTLVPGPTSRVRARAAVGAARAARLNGLYDDAELLLNRETGGDEAIFAVPEIWLERLSLHISCAEFAAAREIADQIASMVDLRGQCSGVRAAAQALIGFALALTGDVDAGLAHTTTAGRILDSLSDTELSPALDAILWLGLADRYAGRYEQAAKRQTRGVALARASGQQEALGRLLVCLAMTRLAIGNLADARACAEEAVAIAQSIDSNQLLMLSRAAESRVSLWQGSVHAAVIAAESVAPFAASHRGWISTFTSAAHGQALIAADDPVGGAAVMLKAAGGPDLPLVDLGSRAEWYEQLARASLAEGLLGQAQRWADQACTAAEESGLEAAYGYAALTASAVLLADDRSNEATLRAMAAAVHFERSGNALDLARARLAIGRALGSDGRREAATTELRRAQAAFAAAGAILLERETARELRRLGVRGSRAAARGDEGRNLDLLTRREREVADQVARGLTNREVAEAMFLSEKTIERHLSSVFNKLGIRSRVALVMLLGNTTSSAAG